VRWLVAILLSVALFAPADVRAQDKRGGIVAVLPLTATNSKMALYSKPVADAVAKRLRAGLKYKVEALSLSGAVPSRVSLVVDGRIVMPDKKRVVLEARIRDPERGVVFVTVSTKPRRRTAIDLLAKELADKLVPRLTGAFRTQRARAARALAARRRAAAAAAARKRDTKRPKTPPRADQPKPAPVDKRPLMLVMEATGKQIANENAVGRVVTPELFRMAKLLGYRALPGGHRGIVDPIVVRNALRAHGGAYALMVHVPAVAFDWHRVLLSARALVRVVVVGRDGKPVFAKTLRTGTIVGSRGDGYPAILHFIANQIVDIFRPKLNRVFTGGLP